MGIKSIFKSIGDWHSQLRRKLIQQAFIEYVINDFHKSISKNLNLNLKNLEKNKIAVKPEVDFKASPELPLCSGGIFSETNLWDEFKETETCLSCTLFRDAKQNGVKLTLIKQTDTETLTNIMDVNFCVVCGKKIE
jgi:hypothetical protein